MLTIWTISYWIMLSFLIFRSFINVSNYLSLLCIICFKFLITIETAEGFLTFCTDWVKQHPKLWHCGLNKKQVLKTIKCNKQNKQTSKQITCFQCLRNPFQSRLHVKYFISQKENRDEGRRGSLISTIVASSISVILSRSWSGISTRKQYIT